MIDTIPHIKDKDLSPDLLHLFNIRNDQIITIKTEAETILAVNAKKKMVNGVKLLIGYVVNPS